MPVLWLLCGCDRSECFACYYVMTQRARRFLWVSSIVRWLYWVTFDAAQDSLEQQLQLEVALSAARDAAAEAGSRQEAAHAEAAELRERVQASLKLLPVCRGFQMTASCKVMFVGCSHLQLCR